MYKRCKVVMLPTNEKSNIYKARTYGLGYYPIPKLYTVQNQGQHLYIISEDTIEVGDWIVYYCHFDRKYKVEQVTKATIEEVSVDGATTPLSDLDGGKIIASTDASLGLPSIPKDFIEKYCEKNGINEVMVEYEHYHFDGDNLLWKPKVSSDNTTTIRLVKNSWTRDEVVGLITNAIQSVSPNPAKGYVDSWIEKNL